MWDSVVDKDFPVCTDSRCGISSRVIVKYLTASRACPPAHQKGLRQWSWEGQEDRAGGSPIAAESWEVGEVTREGERR